MLIFYLLTLLVLIGDVLGKTFGFVTVLPYGVDSVLISAVSWFRGAVETLPYLEIVLTYFLYAVAFEIVLLLVKMVLGSRTPTNIN